MMSDAMATKIDREGIKQRIPHRDPFLFIDEVINIVPGTSATGVKYVSADEPYFAGHFPAQPIMPGVLIIESMAQTTAVLVVETLNTKDQGQLVYFMSIDAAKFRKPVVPGDELHLSVEKVQQRSNVWKFAGVATVGGQKVAEATFSAMIVDAPKS